ncbi:MAG: aminotransferase class IV [Prolixibacteraceae bacterium]|jgi:branched-chain amino acid aminotransferase
MNEGKFILVNGVFVPTGEYKISLPEAEAIGFQEKIRVIRSVFPFFRETLELIKLKLQIFNREFPEFTENDGSELKRQMERTLTKNKQFLGAVLTLTFRFTSDKTSYTIQSEKTEYIDYELNEKGLYLDVFRELRKSASSLSNLSIGSDIFWKIATNSQKTEGPKDLLLLLNTHDQITEVPWSNVYLIRSNKIFSASVEHGAYLDVTQPLLLDIFARLNLEYSEYEGITVEDIQNAEEIFVANAVEGIRWIIGFEGKRYYNQMIRKINELFNLKS